MCEQRIPHFAVEAFQEVKTEEFRMEDSVLVVQKMLDMDRFDAASWLMSDESPNGVDLIHYWMLLVQCENVADNERDAQ